MPPPPVILHHGLFGTGDVRVGPVTLRYFRGIAQAIAARGHPVIAPWVHPCGTVQRRATQLADHVREQLRPYAGQKAILFGHSMGGLDARYAVSRLGLADVVSTVVTVTSPNRGSPFADWVCRMGRRTGIDRLGWLLPLDLGAAADLTTDACVAFNQRTPDAPGVRYYSVTAARPWHAIPPFALHSYAIVRAAEGDNDGLVSVRSGTWGTHLGTWAADHWHTINRRWMPDFSARPTGDIVPYWLRLLEQVVPTDACSTSPSSAAA